MDVVAWVKGLPKGALYALIGLALIGAIWVITIIASIIKLVLTVIVLGLVVGVIVVVVVTKTHERRTK